MNTVVKLQGMGEVGELGGEDVGNECRSRNVVSDVCGGR